MTDITRLMLSLILVSGTLARSGLAQTTRPSTSFDSAGRLTLAYGGKTLLDVQALLPLEINTTDAAGTMTHAWVQTGDYTSKWDAAGKVLTWTFSWGTVTTTFTPTPVGLDLSTVIHNTSPTLTIAGIGLYYSTVQFPRIPSGMSAGGPSIFADGSADPPVVLADYGSGALAVVNPDPTQLYAGFVSSNLTAQNHAYQLWYSGTPHAGWPVSWTQIYRKTPPRGSDTYRVSLRFGPTGSTAQQLAPDAFTNVAKTMPYSVNWPDRRPIGQCVPAGSAPANRSATNPNGWFNDPTVNVNTPAGLAAFAGRLLGYFDQCVRTCKSVNAQALIVWDIEGESSDPYAGDPRQAIKLAPELAYPVNGVPLLSVCCRKVIDSGLRLGFTLRPTQHELVGGVWQQTTVNDPASLLTAKAQWANANLGATVFYIDSIPGGMKGSAGANVLQQAAATLGPKMLLIPEHAATTDFASSAPYLQADQGGTGVPAQVLATYPNAFGCVFVGSLQPGLKANAIIGGAAKAKDIIIFPGWFAAQINAAIAPLYPLSKAKGDPQ